MPWNSGFGLLHQRDDDPIQAAGDIGSTMFHPVGTCKMGDDERAMVQSRLRVRQLGGLRVVDASIMPTVTSGNTNAPTILIAEKSSGHALRRQGTDRVANSTSA